MTTNKNTFTQAKVIAGFYAKAYGHTAGTMTLIRKTFKGAFGEQVVDVFRAYHTNTLIRFYEEANA